LKTNPAPLQSLSASASAFVDSVLALNPKVAVFDCDGTLWAGDAGADFFYWEIERGLVPSDVGRWAVARYDEYKAGKVDEETMCGEMVTINAGVPEQTLEQAAQEFSTIVQPRIFPEMMQLTHRLADAGCDVWAVSSTNVWVVRTGVEGFGIRHDHVLAVTVEIENGRATDRLIQIPTDEGKARVIRQTLSAPVDVCFGNSVHDAAMLEIAGHAFAVNPTPALEEEARQKGWRIYWPQQNENAKVR
jgi:phosphoserine phosphatase